MKEGALAVLDRYVGRVAASYDNMRMNSPKWMSEQAAVGRILSDLQPGCLVLDIPIGTGRFIEYYKIHHMQVTGMDVSSDMLAQAAHKMGEHQYEIALRLGNIFHIDAQNDAYECAVCIRLLNWFKPNDMRIAISELARVSSRHVVLGVRHYVPWMDLKPFKSLSGARRSIRQALRRLHPRTGLVFHEKSFLMSLFDSLRLAVLSAECIESRSDGTDYFIYHLVKNGA